MEINEAAKISLAYLKKFFPKATSAKLEEVEKSEDNKYWNITLSYEDKLPNSTVWDTNERYYKIFKIDIMSGEVRSMKIRDIK